MSFFADLVGSFAKAGADTLDDVTKENTREREVKETRRVELERQTAAEQRQHDLAIARDQAIQKNRVSLEEQIRLDKQKRMSDQHNEIDEEAESTGAQRELARIQALPPGMAGEAFENLKKGTGKTYGVDAGKDPLGKLGTKIDIARKKGYYDVEADLRKLRSDTIAEMTAEHRRQMEVRRTDLTEERVAQGEKRLEILAKKGSGGGSGGGADRIFKTVTDGDGNVYGIRRSGTTVDLGLKDVAFNKKVADTIAKLEKDGPRGFSKLPEAEKRSQAVARITGVIDTGGDAPAPTAAPAAAPSTPRADLFKVIRPGATK